MKKIYLSFHGKKHSLYDNLTNYPPDNYEFIKDVTSFGRMTSSASNIIPLSNLASKTINHLIPISLIVPYVEQHAEIPYDIDFIYASGHIIFRDIAWVVDLEFVTHLCGYDYKLFKIYKNLIRSRLESDNCKKIIPWTLAGRNTIISAFNSRKIEEKTETVYLAVPPKNFKKKYFSKDAIKLLFVGSQNIPRDFYIKGGNEVLETFDILCKEYPHLELIMRSYVPNELKNKYLKRRNVNIIDKIIPWKQLEQEFKEADIFLFPSHNTPGLVILDAMSYELPIITTDIWGNSELVKNDVNGLLIKKSNLIKYYADNFIPNWSSPEALKKINAGTDPKVVKELVEKTRILIEDENLRKKMGKSGRREIDTGKFSLSHRNKKLKKIFDAI